MSTSSFVNTFNDTLIKFIKIIAETVPAYEDDMEEYRVMLSALVKVTPRYAVSHFYNRVVKEHGEQLESRNEEYFLSLDFKSIFYDSDISDGEFDCHQNAFRDLFKGISEQQRRRMWAYIISLKRLSEKIF